MKTVLIFRHAKSSWANPTLADFDRPLAKRGRKAAPQMGEVMASFDCVPDKILSSPAKRARQTVELAAKACGYKNAIQWENNFYGGTSMDLIAALRRLPNTVQRPMLVGHNPTMEETISALLTPYREGWYEDWSIQMPTAALVCLDIHITDWATLELGDAVLRWFLIPRLLRAIHLP